MISSDRLSILLRHISARAPSLATSCHRSLSGSDPHFAERGIHSTAFIQSSPSTCDFVESLRPAATSTNDSATSATSSSSLNSAWFGALCGFGSVIAQGTCREGNMVSFGLVSTIFGLSIWSLHSTVLNVSLHHSIQSPLTCPNWLYSAKVPLRSRRSRRCTRYR